MIPWMERFTRLLGFGVLWAGVAGWGPGGLPPAAGERAPGPPGCATPPAGLSQWWPGNGSTANLQGEGSGTLLYGAGYRPGRVGPAFSFDGLDDQVSLPAGLFGPAAERTFEAWFKTTGAGVILGYQGTGYPDLPTLYTPAVYVGTDGLLRAEFDYAHFGPVTSAFPVNDGEWHHVALSAGHQFMNVYLDGTAIGGIRTGLSGAGQTVNQLGTGYTRDWPGGNGGWFPFQGLVDEPAVYERELSQAEIRSIIRAGRVGKCHQISVSAISPTYQALEQGYRVGASVDIQAGAGSPMGSADVVLLATRPDGASLAFQVQTDLYGHADQTFISSQTGTYRFTVTSVAHPNRPYAPEENVETSDSLTIPGREPPGAATGADFQERAPLASERCMAPPPGLVAWWPANGHPKDIQGAYNGTLTDGAAYGPGLAGQAFVFDGENDAVVLPAGMIYTQNRISFEAWFQTLGDGIILSYQDQPYRQQPVDFYQPAVYVGTDGRLRGEFYQGLAVPITSAGPVNDDLWHHIALAADTDTQTMYLDGEAVGTLSGQLNGYDMLFNQLGIGWSRSWPATNNVWFGFDGSIDEPSLYNRALTGDEVRALYDAGPAGKCPPGVFVAAIDLTSAPAGGRYAVGAQVLMGTTYGQPAAGAYVLLDIALPDEAHWVVPMYTGRDGRATTTLISPQTGEYRFTVLQARAVGRAYDPAHNVETSDRIVVP